MRKLPPSVLQFAADWESARACKDQGRIFTLPVLRANSGGLIVRFNSLQGFVPNPLLSPAHWCKGTSAFPLSSVVHVSVTILWLLLASRYEVVFDCS